MPNFFPCRYFPSFIPKSVNNGIPHTALDTHFNPRTRERCNPGTSTLTAASAHFNPYTPRMVRRKRGNTLMIPTLFQSTPPRGVRRVDRALFCRFRVISIHAPHAGCDALSGKTNWWEAPFQSTHPMRGATKNRVRVMRGGFNFNPRTPCGVRPIHVDEQPHEQQFQSTHPMRSATRICLWMLLLVLFQSTHPMRGATTLMAILKLLTLHFNPRTPCGVRREVFSVDILDMCISIHAPHAGCDYTFRPY